MNRLYPILFLALAARLSAADSELTNWRSGIDVIWGALDGSTKGTDYYEEYLYFDKILDDHKIVYLKSTALIHMRHNSRNMCRVPGDNGAAPNYVVGADGPDGIPASGDEGLIRTRFDRDRSIKGKWAPTFGETSTQLYNVYTAPFTMAESTYGVGDDVSVVGAIGSNGESLSDPTVSYYRGVVDSFGDEWHTLAYADDSNQVLAALGETRPELRDRADDGKTVLIVVNPKTPCFTARVTGTGQFFTTAPKAYWTPRVVAQTTYIDPGASGTVSIELRDINGNNVFYRINGGSYTDAGAATVTLADSAFSTGSNTLEYYYAGNAAYTKTRTVVKSPGYPSAGETHGYAAFRNSAGYDAFFARVNDSSTVAYSRMQYYRTNDSFTGTYHSELYPLFRTGVRWGSGNGSNAMAMKTALVVKVDGFTYKKSVDSPMSYGGFLKALLMDAWLQSDDIGLEDSWNNDAVPNRERYYRGYYDAEPILNLALAYDILIAVGKASQVSGGVTPIEDYYIRDSLARYAYAGMLLAQGANNNEGGGMWPGAHTLTAAVIAMMMPSYTSVLYGTSGADGVTTTTYANCPFYPSQLTWVQTLVQTPTLGTFPDVRFEQVVAGTSEASLVTPPGLVAGGYTMPAYSWGDKLSYLEDGQMSNIVQMYAAMVREFLPAYESAPLLAMIAHGVNGTLEGAKLDEGEVREPHTRYWPYLMNSSWPSVASAQTAAMLAFPSDNVNSDDKLANALNLGLMDTSYEGTAPATSSRANPKARALTGGF